MLAGVPVTIAGFIDYEGPDPLDEVLVELPNGEERTVRGDELTSVFDVIQGHWQTREVYLAGGRLNPSESLAVARHSPDGFSWGDDGSGPAQLALAVLLRATDRKNRRRTLPGVQVAGARAAPASGLHAPPRQGPRLGSHREPSPDTRFARDGSLLSHRAPPQP